MTPDSGYLVPGQSRCTIHRPERGLRPMAVYGPRRLLLPSRVRRRWQAMGQAPVPSASRLLIRADAGGQWGTALARTGSDCRYWPIRHSKLNRRVPPPTRDQQWNNLPTPLGGPEQSELARKPVPLVANEVVSDFCLGSTTTSDGAAGSEPTGHQPIPDRYAPGRRTRSHLFA